MRLTRLSLQAFKVVKQAEIDFGPNLNILYGPNDLGKSTVATAIRAALLVPPSSSEAHSYGPWFASDNPRVELTLVDSDGHYWKVRKTFGTSSSSSAELLHSKDAITFTQDCKARQVEEKLRTMLAWGIPSPGGKGAPRGAPSSFLANVLLAEQTQTDEILCQSIAADADDSGKLRLTKALSTLAQDPLFKEVLQAAQREVDRFFTETGRRKRGQSSSFKEAGDLVKAFSTQLEERKRLLEESSGIEEDVNRLRTERSRALTLVDEANANLAEVQRRFRNSEARSNIANRLAAENGALASIDTQICRFNELTSELRACGDRVRQEESDLAAARAACEAAEAGLHAAEECLRLATSEDAAREQELRRAQLSERTAELTTKLLTATARKVHIDAAINAHEEALQAHGAVDSATAALEKELETREIAHYDGQQRATELEVARAIVAFTRWRSALAAIDESAKAKEAAAIAEKEATQKDAEAEAVDAKTRMGDEVLLKNSTRIPHLDQFKALLQLERDLEKAEAALGGGISVALRPSTEVAIRVLIDQRPSIEATISKDRIFNAERTITLAIADLVDVDITAGSADKRKAVEDLRVRWRDEALPLLNRAGVQTTNEMEGLIAEQSREESSVANFKRDAERLRSEAKGLREQARIHRQKASAETMNVEDVEARRSAFREHDLDTIEQHYQNLGRPSESKADLLHQELASAHKQQQAKLAACEEAVRMADYRASEARKRALDMDGVLTAKLSLLPSTNLDALLADVTDEIELLEKEKAETMALLESHVAEASSEVQNAQRQLLEAQEGHRRTKESRDRASATLDVSRAEYNERSGALGEMRVHIEGLDRDAAQLTVKQWEAELAAIPIEATATSEDVELARLRVEAANREHERAKEELHLKEGALSRVGGAALREDVERLEEARIAAEARERELEIDSEAWRLLRDTLRDVENEESTHLGFALAGPVTARFEELTAGRYHGLRLDAALKVEGVEATSSNVSGDEVIAALSVGTRGQLAALIRLTIADQLRSTIVLDDHLVHTDRIRLEWFRDVLQKTSINTQVIVLTCHGQDYLSEDERPVDAASADVAAGTIRAIDGARVLLRFES